MARCRSRFVLAGTVFVLISLFVVTNWYTLTYFLRPIWDTPPRPFTMIPHYYAQNMSIRELCHLHGWTLRSSPRRVFDAVIFNNELDLLEIRWRELDPFVTNFLLLESSATFTGIQKPLIFQSSSSSSSSSIRFDFARRKLHYSAVIGTHSSNPFDNESRQRGQMNSLLQSAGIKDDDLIIMSDVDEIPSGHTIDLLRNCDGFPALMHLQLQNFLYSFEFPVDAGSWRASVQVHAGGGVAYGHYRRADHLFAAGGWHCSFCLRTTRDIAFKMTAYSHADRVRRRDFLRTERIQEVVCRGGDLYGLLPEEYTFRELVHKIGDIPRSLSAVNLPAFLLKNPARFKFLLPGNCIRES